METKTAKTSILLVADQVLDRMVIQVNDGFTGGKISKTDLASWIIRYFENHDLEGNLEKIRKDHFDQVA